jgi:cytochrome c biogenesis protein CcmG, thiol:disulfide interchange protein DsbE
MAIPVKKPIGKMRQIIPWMFIGVGLVVIWVVALSFLTKGDESEDLSVVPSKVNFPAPEITLSDLSGQPVSLSDYQQQIVLINNWATWCPPCKSEMPTLQKFFQEHAKQGFILIGIEAGDSKQDVLSFVNEYDLTFPILLDPDTDSVTLFHNDNLPSSYVINRLGIVVLAWTGPISYTMLEMYITPLLEQ